MRELFGVESNVMLNMPFWPAKTEFCQADDEVRQPAAELRG
jgi:hypothetical protein